MPESLKSISAIMEETKYARHQKKKWPKEWKVKVEHFLQGFSLPLSLQIANIQ